LDALSEDNIHIPGALLKRKMYEFERELRAVVYKPASFFKRHMLTKRLRIAVDLDVLIEHVYVGPGQPDCFVSLAEDAQRQ
jgi:hypothetical protein